ncbi:hypothetical protein IHE45_05G006000 [Dioscorea alata]|uniref:Uncharacterized protein n=1 Tax=Dioscorea alata TaxID=55571 RepID=A0ACB7VZD7_DIOAL|nr:hypothetical protein IHE45_05G006000 [Dioscorea alata]
MCFAGMLQTLVLRSPLATDNGHADFLSGISFIPVCHFNHMHELSY